MKKRLKGINIFRIMWISGIYILLIFILYIVVIYKVKWEYKQEDSTKYVYFYKCDNEVCLSNKKINNFYSRLECFDKCPTIIDILENNIIKLDYNGTYIKYNYITGETMKEG